MPSKVVSIKAIGIAMKLTLEGISQLAYPQTWVFVAVVVLLVITQLNYLNKQSHVSLKTQNSDDFISTRQNCPENPNRKKGTIVDVEDEDEKENEDLVRINRS
ncbi:hypothetical protein IFM89_030828 [Coptis chinensis]|uniref:Probable magnesium transporter n=1 Tax=Coptis chinensis TaxID=261450 RepID=A0A835M2I1_9MAGN|nr:hypothetical protein IFM89_030828 [Coptis chinensis]